MIFYKLLQIFPFLRFLVQPSYPSPKSGAKTYVLGHSLNFKAIEAIERLKVGKVSKSGGKYVWDIQGNILDGKKQTGGGDQDEHQESLFTVYIDNLTIKNFFVKNNKNAMTIKGDNCTIEHFVFLNVGEDAIATVNGAGKSISIKNGYFQNWGGDKCVQLNECKNALVENCHFVGCKTGIRWGDTARAPSTGKSVNNSFYGVRTCHHPAGKGTKIAIDKGEKYKGIKEKVYLANGATASYF